MDLQALNVVLRVAWVETVMPFHRIGAVESRLIDFLLACLEVIRRGHWNFYRSFFCLTSSWKLNTLSLNLLKLYEH